eukprot:TRINITY_DN7733_c0_g2_i1.p1 TRINITY_DN7733_c0_g2~~TRINITY_DN7733_c0_g2_i1.p1  ORF type:complete len:1130 (+),score=246.13 TRINITY_DN7733_c0_g2_i1:74-3463(+)
MVTKEEVASFLIENGYHLTALELYQEVIENEGAEVEALKNYFTQNQPTFDGDFRPVRKLDDGRGKDEKTLVLEYELRKAREDITGLRSQLTSIVKRQQRDSTDLSASTSITNPQQEEMIEKINKEGIKEHEKRTLNFLIKNYLLQNSYSITGITFSEEMQENINEWTDVGLETPEPPPLLSLYRYFFDNEDAGIQGALTKTMNENMRIKRELAERGEELRGFKKKYQLIQQENETRAKRQKELESALEEAKKNLGTFTEGAPNPNILTSVDSPARPLIKPDVVPDKNAINASAVVDRTILAMGEGPLTLRGVFRGMVQRYRLDFSTALSSLQPSSEKPNTTNEEADKNAEATLRVSQEIEKLMKSDFNDYLTSVKLVADCLPYIIPNVLIPKRAETVPVILSTITQHPDPKVRYNLTKLLFNLIKKPNDMQRKMIMNGCVALATIIGPQRTEQDILTQCWEQINDKRDERRVLVADSCGILAVYAPQELRPSLLLSILQQMLDDKSPMVRAAVAKNLSLLVNLFDAEGEKYAQVEQLFLRLLYDVDGGVSNNAKLYLLSSLANWADILDTLHTRILTTLLNKMQEIVQKGEKMSDMYRVPDLDAKRIAIISSCLVTLMPRLKESLISLTLSGNPQDAAVLEADSIHFYKTISAGFNNLKKSSTVTANGNDSTEIQLDPFTSAFKLLGTKQLAKLQSQLDQLIVSSGSNSSINSSSNNAINASAANTPSLPIPTLAPKPILEWVKTDFVPRLLKIGVTLSNSTGVGVLVAEIVRTLCVEMGPVFTKNVVQAIISKDLGKGNTSDNKPQSVRLLPIYIEGVLFSLGDEVLFKYIKDVTIEIATDDGWDHNVALPILGDSLATLYEKSYPARKTQLLSVLTDQLVANPDPQVRASVVHLCKRITPLLKGEDLKKVVPTIFTLSNDSNNAVKYACISALGIVAMSSADDQVLKRVSDQLSKYLDDSPGHMVKLELVHTLGAMVTQVKPVFRDTFVLPRLVEQCRKNNSNISNTEHRREMAQALIDAVRSVNSINPLSQEMVRDSVLPALRSLTLDAPIMDASFKDIVQSMVSDMETINENGTRRSQPNSTAFLGLTSNGSNQPLPKGITNLGTAMGRKLGNLGVNVPKWDWKS